MIVTWTQTNFVLIILIYHEQSVAMSLYTIGIFDRLVHAGRENTTICSGARLSTPGMNDTCRMREYFRLYEQVRDCPPPV
jgi:hypothetical protein